MTEYAIWPPDEERGKPGYGPISDGVPRADRWDAGDSEKRMPPPPRQSRYCGKDIGEDDTRRIRRAR